MKLKGTYYYSVMLCALLAGASGCDDSDSQVETRFHAITAVPDDHCRIDVKSEETAGEQVRATVTVTDESSEIAAVTYNGASCTFVSGEGSASVYEFTMPDRAVTLAATTRAKTPGIHSIRVENTKYYDIQAPENAGGGKLSA